jgi:LysR family transcriptional regulator, glycine cleavage system transcriptional activator
MPRRLPPLNSLRAFEAAARHGSFKEAAGELHVTPAAISQQVRLLEEYCQTRLFEREPRGLVLTERALAALPLLRRAFDGLEEATSVIAPQPSPILTVSVAPSFAARWLLPRLDGFRALHPDYEIRLDATEALARFDADDIDVAIRFGRGVYPGMRSDALMAGVAFPVCGPKLLEGRHPLSEPADLAHHTLLHARWTEDEYAPSWKMWLAAAGVPEISGSRSLAFSTVSLALQAAIDGHGIALAAGGLLRQDLAEGRLVRPFVAAVEPPEFGYYLVYPDRSARQRKVQAFRAWLLAEVRSDGEPGDPALPTAALPTAGAGGLA